MPTALDVVAWLRREGITPIPLPPRSKGAIREISKGAIDNETSFLHPVEKRLQAVDDYWGALTPGRATPEHVGVSIGILKGWNNGVYVAILDIDRWDLVDDFAQSSVLAQCPMVTGKKGAKLLAKATANRADDWPDVPLQWRPKDVPCADPELELFTGNAKKHCIVYGEHEASTREDPIFYTFVRGFGNPIPTLALDIIIEEMDRIASLHGLSTNLQRYEADLEDIIFEESPRAHGETICNQYGVTMADVVNRPHGARNATGGYLCKHPVHGATGNGNLFVNTQNDWWYCFRCGSSGDPLTWHAVDKGYINCGDAHWRLDSEIFKKCVDDWRRTGLIPQEDVIVAHNRRDVDEIAQWLVQHPKHLITFYRWTLDDYHYGEWTLKTTIWRGAHRIAFRSVVALLHFDLTGKSRGGKTSLMSRFLSFFPESRKEVFVSVSPRAIWYKTRTWKDKYVSQKDSKTGEELRDDDGIVLKKRISVKESDPSYYVGKLIVFLELTDMKEYEILKTLAEEYEVGENVFSTVIEQESVDFKIECARGVITTSVSGIQNDHARQILNRFIQTPLAEPRPKSDEKKVEMVGDHDLNERDIRKDWRVAVLRKAITLLYQDGDKVAIHPPNTEVKKLTKRIDKQLHRDGFNLTQIRQFHSLALCAAFEKRFARGDGNTMQITEEDVLEAWYLISEFGAFTRASLTRAEYKIIEALKTLQFGEHAEGRPTQQEIQKETELARATINDALRVHENAKKGIGKFLQYGYVDYERGPNGSYVFGLTQEGRNAINVVTKEITIDEVAKKPKNPVAYPYAKSVAEIKNSVNSANFDFEIEFENGLDSPDCETNDPPVISGLEFDNSIKYHTTPQCTSPLATADNEQARHVQNHQITEFAEPAKAESAQNEQRDPLQPSTSSNSVPNSAGCNENESDATDRTDDVDISATARDEQSPAHLAILIHDELRAVKHASSHGVGIKPEALRAMICDLIKEKHPQWRDYPLRDFYRKLAEDDPLIGSLIADCTGAHLSGNH